MDLIHPDDQTAIPPHRENLIAGSAKSFRDPPTARLPVPTLLIHGIDTQSVAVSFI
jgi:hypothetical protein